MRPLRTGVALVTVTSLLTFGAAAANADTSADLSRYTGQKLAWGNCTFKSDAPSVQCAELTVPRDWADPGAGKDFKVYISRIAATGTKQGVILTNPGGPGGQGASLAPSIAKLEPTLSAAYDVLGMDPRGTGQSGVAGSGINCEVPIERLPKGPLDARDRSKASIAAHQQGPRAVAEACQSQADAPFITTWQTAHDMDLLRQLTGADKLNYLGYSYGTWLGAKYASLFPERTGRVVLDSSVDWQGRLQADFEDFPRMDQRQNDKVFLPWLNRQAPDLFGKTVADGKKAIERGRVKAAALGTSPDGYDALFAGNGSVIRWLIVLLNLSALLDGSGAQLAHVPSAEVRRELDVVSHERFGVPAAKLTAKTVVSAGLGLAADDYKHLNITRDAVACNDQPTRSTQWYKALSDVQGRKYPLFGWQYGLSEVCGPWTDLPREPLPQLPRSVQDKVLLVQGEFDPQTSYEQAMDAKHKAPGVDVLRVDDAAFHGQYALQGNPCVDGVVNTYFLHGSKTDNSICPSIPLFGDETVYPVRGPVDSYLAGHKPGERSAVAKTVTDLLRMSVADTVSELNHH